MKLNAASLKGIFLISQPDGTVKATGPRSAQMARGLSADKVVLLKDSRHLTESDKMDLEVMKECVLLSNITGPKVVFLDQLVM